MSDHSSGIFRFLAAFGVACFAAGVLAGVCLAVWVL